MRARTWLLIGVVGCAAPPADDASGDASRFDPRDFRAPTDAQPVVDARPVQDLDQGLGPFDARPPALDAEVDLDRGPPPPRPDAGDDLPDATPGCPLGAPCNPIPVDVLPFVDRRDTRDAPVADWDRYACAPGTDEGGGEWVYAVRIDRPGTLTVQVDDLPGDGIDVDVHLLDAPDPDACVARDNDLLSAPVTPGVWFVVADTWVDGGGAPLPGPYRLDIGFRARAEGDCATRDTEQRMAWRACDPGIDCFEARDADGDLARFVRLPSSGPVVKEAHLVTVDDDGFAGDWPSAARDGLDAHYRLSQAATGYAMNRREPWAPAGEGGSRWGQAAHSRPLPVLDEAWYVTMFWSPRPAAGSRMIVRNPANGRAVVAAAGYETGPGSNTALAGVSEEIHDHLGTTHRDVLEVGFAVDGDLPLGPVDCR